VESEERPVTLKALADLLGLEVSTVSPVLNGGAEDGRRPGSALTTRRVR
jgi:LacI family transcriptional regulator